VDYTFDSTEGIHSSATLVFPPGKMRNYIPLPVSFTGVLRISLVNPVNADLTGSRTLFLQNLSSATASVLSPLGASWRYLDDGSDQGTAWRAPGFNDSTWSNGIARLGFGGDAAATTIIRRYLSGNSGPQFTNYYFRRAIIVTNPMDFAMLQFRYQRDDGCIVYLNGTAVITNNMPPGPATNHTFAATTISGAAETQRFWTNTVSPALLQPGTNVMAAEVHQSTPASSDIAWELEVQGLRPSSPARIAISRLGGDAFLYWSDATFSLQQSDNTDGAWGSVSGAKSPVPLIPGDSSKFFRLRKP
jgi:hypothetical protein